MYTVYKEKNNTLLYLSTARSTSSFYYDFNRNMHVSYPQNMLKELELIIWIKRRKRRKRIKKMEENEL